MLGTAKLASPSINRPVTASQSLCGDSAYDRVARVTKTPLAHPLGLAPWLSERHPTRTLRSLPSGCFDAHFVRWIDDTRFIARMFGRRRAGPGSRRVPDGYLLSITKCYYPFTSSVPHLPRRALAEPESKITLSIIIVNWNTHDALRNCLESIYAPTGVCLETVVVDNASEDGSVKMVERTFPQVRLIENPSNVGFAKAGNQGMLLSRGDYILLLNSDAQIEEQALARMMGFMQEHREAAAMGPRLLLRDGRPQPYSFGGDPTLGYLLRRGLNLVLAKRYLHDWGTEEIAEVDWVSGASLVLRRSALEETGLLDENFFLYFEDNDLCLRLRQKGWKVYFNPRVEVVHLGGESLSKNEPARAEYYRSLRYLYSKHYGGGLTILLTLLLPLYRFLMESTGRADSRPSERGP